MNELNNEKELLILLNQLNNEYLNILIDLLNKENHRLSYIVIWILINITYIDLNESLFGENTNVIINKISLFLGKNKGNKVFTLRGIILLNNITTNNEIIKEILLNYNIFQYFVEIYEKYNLDNKFIHNLLKCIGNFIINLNKEYTKQYLLIIKIIKNELNPFSRIKYLNNYLFYIQPFKFKFK